MKVLYDREMKSVIGGAAAVEYSLIVAVVGALIGQSNGQAPVDNILENLSNHIGGPNT